uniref:Protein NLRC3 n=1 Tax=Chromera velia CCMP2878 TaxID=1169474 RepID=A0A0G4I855_9ALVE|eukprot:Cvel_11772.t1-p1 / transcript=Cvel_11772.t1 / gene=Cvel_11772 / organism=Chromera_velia_CCMP2878 / gene_product=hypothetical protein / transcript_product=hypothetical protein / location=Cvel_scaffold748:58119-61851(+) / protein_length=440 / sequence_SO=supercontig / SO=protein_coding / is_pseudo=false
MDSAGSNPQQGSSLKVLGFPALFEVTDESLPSIHLFADMTRTSRVLQALFNVAQPTSKDVAELASSKESFGIAWLTLCCVMKSIVQLPLKALDFLGPSVIQEEALPLLRDFLERQNSSPEDGEASNSDDFLKIDVQLKELSAERASALCDGRVPSSPKLNLRMAESACAAFVTSCQTHVGGPLALPNLHLDFGSFREIPPPVSPFPQAITGSVVIKWDMFVGAQFDRLATLQVSRAFDSLFQDLGRSFGAGRLPSLERLVLLHADVGMPGMQSLFSPEAATLSRLLYLDLSEAVNFGGGGWVGTAALMAGLGAGKLPVLRTLKLRRGRVRREGMLALADAVRQNGLPCLEELDLEENWINSTHVMSLVGALKTESLPNLRLLNLTNTQVGERGGRALGEAMNEGKLRALCERGRLMLSMTAAIGFTAGAQDRRCLPVETV